MRNNEPLSFPDWVSRENAANAKWVHDRVADQRRAGYEAYLAAGNALSSESVMRGTVPPISKDAVLPDSQLDRIENALESLKSDMSELLLAQRAMAIAVDRNFDRLIDAINRSNGHS